MVKNKLILYTIISAFLFTLFIIVSSLSPLADTGPNVNQFGSLGMWSSIAFILIAYALPLILYKIHPASSKIMMAIFCMLGIFLALTVCFIIIMYGVISGKIIALLGVAAIAIAICIINIMWFFIAFSKRTNLA